MVLWLGRLSSTWLKPPLVVSNDPPPASPPPAPNSRVRLIRDTARSDSDQWLQVELSDSEEDDLTGRRNQSRGNTPPQSHNAFLQLPLPNIKPQPQLSPVCVCVCVGIITVCNFSPPPHPHNHLNLPRR